MADEREVWQSTARLGPLRRRAGLARIGDAVPDPSTLVTHDVLADVFASHVRVLKRR